MRYFLSSRFALKWLESPCLYDHQEDELYELDSEAFAFLKKCATPQGSDDGANPAFISYCLSEGILGTDSVTCARPPLIESPYPSLRYLELQISDKCNLRCKHCYIGRPEGNELSVDEMKGVLREFEEMQGLRLLITGGEPLMHSRFEELNALLPGFSFRKILFSNGLLLNDHRLKRLNVDEIQFSVDGMECGHDALRGRGTFKAVMRAVAQTIACGIGVSIATMIHSKNLTEFKEMEVLFKDMGVRDWTVDLPCVSGALREHPLYEVSPEVAGAYLRYGFGGGLHGGGEGFGCGLHLFSVLAGGTLSKCAFFRHEPVGTVAEGLRKSWERQRPIRLETLECFDKGCEVIDVCRGGCRYRASTAQGSVLPKSSDGRAPGLRRDIVKCYQYGIM